MNKNQLFSTQNKNKTPVNGEISDDGLIWRKLSNGTGSWRYDFVINSQRFKGVLGKEKDGYTLSQARNNLRNIKAESQLKVGFIRSGTLQKQKFCDAAESFLSWSKGYHKDYKHNHQRIVNHLIPKFGKCKIGEISTGDVETYREELLNACISKSTIKKIISLLSGIYKYAAKHDKSIQNPTQDLDTFRIEPTIMTVLTHKDTDDLLEITADSCRDQSIIGLALFAGLRASEILGLTWGNVDLNNNQIHIVQTVTEGKLFPTTKSGRKRTIIISKSLQRILKNKREHEGWNGYVISPDNGNSHYYGIQKIFKGIRESIDIANDYGIHALRHTFATRAVECGITLPVLQEWMGHSDIKTTMGYIHVSTDYKYQQAELLA